MLSLIKKLNYALVIFWVGSASANSIESVFSCTVKDNNIVQIEEGKIATYKGFIDQFEIGDNIEMRLLYRDLDGDHDDLLFYIGDQMRDRLLTNVSVFKNYLDSASSFSPTGFFALDGGGRYIRYKNNTIRVNQDGQPHIVLKQYTNDRWNAVFTTIMWDPLYTHTYAADCILTKNTLASLTKAMVNWGLNARY